MKSLRFLTAATSILLPCLIAGGQSHLDEKTTTFRLDVRMVQVDTQVIDKKTRHARPSLTKDDFEVLEDNVPQKISSFSQDTMPLSVVLLFDLTDSVRPVLKSLAEGALEALHHLKP